MNTFATLFSGGELAGVGFQAAGLKHLWGVEYDAAIASVARTNGFDLMAEDVRTVDYATLERPDWLHMSPVCKNASVAKADGKEAPEDIETAQACVRAIVALQPSIISLENVWGYRTFEAFKLLLKALTENGYKADYWHLNSANYGVPQTRQRLILLARRDRYPQKPQPTHSEPSDGAQMQLFASPTLPWVGWYEAIADLIPELPESKFANWQLKRLPEEAKSFMHPYTTADGTTLRGSVVEPMFSVTGSTHKQMPHAFLLSNNKQEWSDGMRHTIAPAHGITEQSGGRYRAFLVDPNNGTREATVREEGEPAPSVLGSWMRRPVNIPAAFLVNQDSMLGMVDGEARSFTITASQKSRDVSAWLNQGRVVRMTPRALARFQSVPDWYELPEKASLACTVIGNGVPCLLAQRVAESQLEAARKAA